MLLRAEKISKDYLKTTPASKSGRNKSNSAKIRVLDELSLNVNQGDFIAITGKSGSGKSTLLHILGTIESFDKGSLLLNGKRFEAMSDEEKAICRNQNIGFVFQAHHLLSDFNALENVMIPGLIAKKNKSFCVERAKYLLNKVGLNDRQNHLPAELSGGEQQRVAVARALFNEPDLILADEATGNLDSSTGSSIMDLLYDLHGEGITMITVTHNEQWAMRAPRHLILHDGKVEEQ